MRKSFEELRVARRDLVDARCEFLQAAALGAGQRLAERRLMDGDVGHLPVPLLSDSTGVWWGPFVVNVPLGQRQPVMRVQTSPGDKLPCRRDFIFRSACRLRDDAWSSTRRAQIDGSAPRAPA